MPEVENHGLVWHGFLTQIDADKLAHGAGIIECFFGTRIGEFKLVLKKVDAQHPLNTDRPSTCPFGLRIVGLDHLTQCFPGNDPVHLFQKGFLAGLFALFLEIIGGKTLLAHRSLPN